MMMNKNIQYCVYSVGLCCVPRILAVRNWWMGRSWEPVLLMLCNVELESVCFSSKWL